MVDVIVVSQEGQCKAVPFDELVSYLSQGYKLATPTESDQYRQARRNKSDLRE